MNSNAYLCIKKNMATMMTLKSYIAAMLFLAIIAVPELKAQRIVVPGPRGCRHGLRTIIPAAH